MKKRAMNCIAIMSSLLLITTVIIWGRSYWKYDQIWFALSEHVGGDIQSLQGDIQLRIQVTQTPWPVSTFAWGHATSDYVDTVKSYEGRDWRFFGFGATLNKFDARTPQMSYSLVGVPYWFLVLMFLSFPVVWMRSRRKTQPDCCKHCQYDLRGSTNATTCPECGTLMKTH